MATDDRIPPEARAALAELFNGLGFLTRIPGLARPAAEAPRDLAAAAWSFPVAGAAIGLAGGIVLIVAMAIGLAPILAAILAVLATVLVTGALHEAALARTADGFAAGDSAAQRLALMRAPGPGIAGTLALIFTVLLRAGALAGLAALGDAVAVFVLMAAEAASRAAMVRVWSVLPPARAEGLSYSAGRPDERTALTALVIGAVIAALLTLLLAGIWSALVALAGTAAVTLAFESLCRRRVGGQTGDTLGASQQLALAAYLLLALAFA